MPDNWSFVIAAYGLAALALAGYWRFLRRRERELERQAASAAVTPRGRSPRPSGRSDAAPRRQPAPPTPAR